MLGDLTAEKPSVKHNTRLQFKQSKVNLVYINHLYELFKEYCGSKPINLSRFDNRPNKMKTYHAVKFQTLSLPCFNKYRELFYNSVPQGPLVPRGPRGRYKNCTKKSRRITNSKRFSLLING
jgi:hypothetical protein